MQDSIGRNGTMASKTIFTKGEPAKVSVLVCRHSNTDKRNFTEIGHIPGRLRDEAEWVLKDIKEVHYVGPTLGFVAHSATELRQLMKHPKFLNSTATPAPRLADLTARFHHGHG